MTLPTFVTVIARGGTFLAVPATPHDSRDAAEKMAAHHVTSTGDEQVVGVYELRSSARATLVVSFDGMPDPAAAPPPSTEEPTKP